MKTGGMMRSLYCLARIALLDPSLSLLVWRVKRQRKTFLGYPQILSLVQNFIQARARCGPSIQVAEFGVGRGGSAFILGKLVDIFGGKLVLYDLFGRIPPPTEIDGEKALLRYQVILTGEDERYYGNTPNLKELILNEMARICSLRNVEIIEGRYEEILPQLPNRYSFCLVHIDCDWYESYRAVLNYLRNNLCPKAILQLDDYATWQGVPRAVSEATWLTPYKKWLVNGSLVIDTGQCNDRQCLNIRD
ncbi:MAG: TylF/MycF/NovP-related O-methyltransferase [Candidatus Methanomethylicaceae archaeon]